MVVVYPVLVVIVVSRVVPRCRVGVVVITFVSGERWVGENARDGGSRANLSPFIDLVEIRLPSDGLAGCVIAVTVTELLAFVCDVFLGCLPVVVVGYGISFLYDGCHSVNGGRRKSVYVKGDLPEL